MNPYQVLGVESKCSTKEIKEAYRDLSKVFHPDKQPFANYQLSVRTFEEIDAAYKILSTEFNRHVFEYFGHGGIKIVIEHQEKFEGLRKLFDEGRDVRGKIRAKIIKIKRAEMDKLLYKDIVRVHSFGMHFQTLNKQFRAQSQAYSQLGLRLPKWQGIESEIRFLNQYAYQYSRQMKSGGYGVFLNESSYRAFRSVELPVLNLVQLKLDLVHKQHENEIVGLLSATKKINDHFILEGVLEYKKGKLSPMCGLQIQDLRSNTLNLSLAPSFYSSIINYSVSDRFKLEFGFSRSHTTIQGEYEVVRNKYFQSGLRGTIALTDEHPIDFGSSLKFVFKKVNFEYKIGLNHKGYLQREIVVSKHLSKFQFPIKFRKGGVWSTVLELALPHAIAGIWQKGFWSPSASKEMKKAKALEPKLLELKQKNDQTRSDLRNNENHIKYLDKERELNGLVIIVAYLGESERIQQFSKDKRESLHLICVTEQLQGEVFDSGLMLPPRKFDLLDGFYKADVRTDLSKYSGYVEYTYKGKLERKIWSWHDPLTIGNVSRLNGFSLFPYILKMVLPKQSK